MKLIHAFCMFVIIISEISYATSKNVEATASTVRGSDNLCKNNKCIMKCCGIGKYIHKVDFKDKNGGWKRKTICDNYNETETNLDTDFDKVFIYKPNLTIFEIKPDMFKANRSFKYMSMDFTEFGFNFGLNERSEVLIDFPNAYVRWVRIPNNMYCIDYIMREDVSDPSGMILKPGIWSVYNNVANENDRPDKTIMIVGMLLSCFFLVLVLVVYGILSELRNLCGQVLMAYVASQLGAFLMLVVMRIMEHAEPVCEGLTYVIYFFFLASFCWMNVMSYDIWWTFRGYAKARPIHRRGEDFKFLMYCLYAFGLPLAMTIALGVINNVDMTDVPWFITPKIPAGGCFIKEEEKLLYLYIPMLILILCNWMFYIMTAFNIWRLSRGTAVLDSGSGASSSARRLNRRRFVIYLKLSVVMGLNWLLELASYITANRMVSLVADCYNILIGVFIFLIFVCKRKIFKKLRQRFASNKKSKWYPPQEDASRTVTSTDGSSSVTQEANVVPLMRFTGYEEKANESCIIVK